MIEISYIKFICFLTIIALLVQFMSSISCPFCFQNCNSVFLIAHDHDKPIVLYAKIIPLTKDFAPAYINFSVSLGYGELIFELKNYNYEFRVDVNDSLKKPYVTVKNENNTLLIVDHTPRIVEIVPIIPCRIVLKPVSVTGSQLVFKLELLFSREITYRDIIPNIIREMFGPTYLFKNGEFYPINDTVNSLRNITLIVRLNPSNNYASINATPVGFFPLYINILNNAQDIEKFCDKGLLRFSYKGFYGDILYYLGHRLFLQYSGPHMPLEIISDSYITVQWIGKYEYIYIPEPTYFINYNGLTATVPVSRDVFIHPWKYNASYIISHIKGFKLIRQEYGWHNIIKHYPLCDIQYLYKYPVSGDLVLPLPNNVLFNASYILISDLRISQQNYTLIENYDVGYLPTKYMTIQTGNPLQLYALILLISVPPIVIIALVIRKWLRRRKY